MGSMALKGTHKMGKLLFAYFLMLKFKKYFAQIK